MRPLCRRQRRSGKPPATTLQMQKQSGVAQDLTLLENLVADVAVAGMKFLQLALEGVSRQS